MRISMDASGYKKKQHDKKIHIRSANNLPECLTNFNRFKKAMFLQFVSNRATQKTSTWSNVFNNHFISCNVCALFLLRCPSRIGAKVVVEKVEQGSRRKKTKNLTKNKARKQIRKTIDILDMLKWLFHRL